MKDEIRVTVRIADGGRVVIPSAVRQRMGVNIGDELIVTVSDNLATLANARQARQRACRRIQQHLSRKVSLCQELLGERKKEARRE